jgi:hypothetical protein
MSDTCRSCHAPVVWLRTASGKAMICDDTPTARAYQAAGKLYDRAATPPHWGTCPHAHTWKRRPEPSKVPS